MTNPNVEKIRSLSEGRTIAEISDLTGFDRDTVYRTLKKHQLPFKRVGVLSKKDELRQYVLDNHSKMTWSQMARCKNVELSMIYRLMRELNITSPKEKNEKQRTVTRSRFFSVEGHKNWIV